MSRRFSLACVQLHSIDDLEHNLERCRFWIREAAKKEVELVLLPEDFAFLAKDEKDKLNLSDKQLNKIVETIREEAIRHRLFILAGGHPVRDPELGKLYNISTLFSPEGEIIAQYQKIHLFDAYLPDSEPILESHVTIPGHEIQLAETPLCNIGFSICYDLRFPELYRRLRLQGAELLTIPAAFALMTGKDHWEILLRARAIENQCYVAAPGQWGRHSETRHSFGHAMICDPWGAVIASVSEGEGIAVADFDPEYLEKVRQTVPCHQHIRHDIFSLDK